MAVTRINNNQITTAVDGNVYVGINAAAKLQNYSITSNKIANSLVYGSDLTVSGNLTVNGTTTTVDTINTLIKDPILTLADGQTSGVPTVDIGLLGLRGNQNSSFLGWNEANTQFAAVLSNTTASNTTVAITQYADFKAANIIATANLSVTGNIIGAANFTGNVTAGNLISVALVEGVTVSASGNVIGGNVTTAGEVSATGNVIGGNVLTGGLVSATGNVIGGNLTTGGEVSATGNIYGGNVSTAGNVTASYFIGNISGNIDAAGSNTQVQFNDVGDILGASANFTFDKGTNVLTISNGNVQGGNLLTGGLISATGNATAGNLVTSGLVSATGNVIAPSIQQSGTYQVELNLGASTGIVEVLTNGNSTQFLPAGQIRLDPDGTGEIFSGTSDGSQVVLATTQSQVNQLRGGNVIVQTGAGGAVGNTWAFNQDASMTAPGTISAVGQITGANILTGGLMSAGGNITSATNVNTPNVVGATGLSLTTGSGDIVLNTAGNIDASNSYINNVLDPIRAQDAATKEYVDNAVSAGLTVHEPVLLEANTAVGGTYAQGGTTATVTDTVAGNTVVFSTVVSPQVNDQYWFTNSFNGIVGNTAYFVVSAPNTSAAVLSTTYNGSPVSNITGGTGLTEGVRINSGIGATLTNAGANATLVIDGVTTTANIRVLIYSEANAVHNGVYVVNEPGNATTAWQLTRSTDADVYGPKSTDELDVGDYFYVQSGDSGAGESYVMTAPSGPFIIGYANLTFTQFSASQVYTANTSAGLSLIGTVFSAKVDNDTTAFDGGGNIIVKASANLTTPNIGAATGTSLSVTGDVTANTNISAVGNVIGGNVSTAGLVTATGNITGGNVLTGGLISATGNATAGNLLTGGLISATGNVNGGNIISSDLVQGVTVSASGNVIGGNVSTAGLITATGNITGGNVLTGGLISATGNATAGNVLTGGLISATGNVDAGNLLTGGLISATGTITSLANITGGNLLTGGLISATGNVDAGNLLTGGLISATGNVTSANVNTGNISLSGNVISTLNVSANITGPNIIGTTSGTFGNIVISGDNITDTNGRVNFNTAVGDVDFAVNGLTANVFYVDAGANTASFGSSSQVTNAIVAFNTTTSIKLPAGSTAERPSNASSSTGMLRFNTTNNGLELYDNTEWTPVGTTTFTVIADEQFTGDGSNVAFTLGSSQTTNSCIVSINGIVQIPGTAYSVAGTFPTCVLTFTEAPAVADLIDVREITTTTTIDALANSSGNAEIRGNSVAAQFDITGNLIPTGTANTQTLGSATNYWQSLYVGGNTIYLGGLQLKSATGNVFSIFASDGTTPATFNSTTSTTGNVTAGNINGNVIYATTTLYTPSILNTAGNGVGNIGNATGYFNTIFAKATSAQYADLAEKYVADAEYTPGTVVSFGGAKEVTVSVKDADRAVAGVVSTNPSYIMNATLDAEYVATVAFTGRVPTKVTGTVSKGDLMVSNGDGTARAEVDPKAGSIIGKALEDFTGTEGTIEVVVGRF